jgi:hypothetical protein
MPVSTATKTLFSKARMLTGGGLPVVLGESQLYGIFILICNDLGWDLSAIQLNPPLNALPTNNYYEVPLNWFESHVDCPDLSNLLAALQTAIEIDEDFGLYFGNVCSLHKRRLKYQEILSYQPKPTMNQVGPRGLLEYGICNSPLLYNWMLWRKWIYDVDNRSAQETGYLFEPVLANSLGGTPVDARNSPVKRIDGDGNQNNKSRQIDCYIAAENLAYEFKLRITIAASGQGRFGEELSFARECRIAGITPILIVLDPTPSTRLTEVSKMFVDNGGHVYIGEEAWQHLEEKAGAIMANFIDNYIKPPLAAINEFDTSQLDSISLSWEDNRIIISTEYDSYIVERNNNNLQVDFDETDDEE